MKSLFNLTPLSATVVAGLLILGSCNKNDTKAGKVSATDSQNLNSASSSATYASEPVDLAVMVMAAGASNSQLGGRMTGAVGANGILDISSFDDRLACAAVTVAQSSSSTSTVPDGTISVVFPASGCADKRGVTRKGTITIRYHGNPLVSSSYAVVKFSGYTQNGIGVAGKDSLITVSNNISTSLQGSLTFKNYIIGGKITYTDETTITRTESGTIYVFELYLTDTKLNTRLTSKADNVASGTTRKGASYTSKVTTDEVWKSGECSGVFIPVSGKETLTVGSTVYSVDFGSGTCDNEYTVSFNGTTQTFKADANGN